MIPVAEALDRLLALVAPLPPEWVALDQAAGRVLARPLAARADQPGFAAAAMDGYAVLDGDAYPGAVLRVIGEAAAGHPFAGAVAKGEAVRIFTGAPVPPGATRVVIQEDVRREGYRITLSEGLDPGTNIRPAGTDFHQGWELSPRRLGAADIALLAAMNHPRLPVSRRPVVALIATGDELVQPGEVPGAGQIVASNSYGLAAMVRAAGAEARILPIARDTEASLVTAFRLAEGADLVVTIGGASVGDHDLVGQVAAGLGMERSFYKVAMRPGKPLMAGRLGGAAMVGLPGNPVSAMVCGTIFLLPMLDRMMGLPAGPRPRLTARLTAPVAANGPREHYMRARLEHGRIAALERQDSSLLTVLAEANALLVRPPNDPARVEGDEVEAVAL